MIRNIVFDMGNVLLAHTPRDYCFELFSDPEVAQAVYTELFRKPEWIQLDEGTITEEQAVAQVQARIPQYAPEVQRAMDLWHTNLTPVEGMPQVIERLEYRQYKLYLLSNTSLRFLKFYKNVKMWENFDGFLISAKEKLLKPDTAIYQLLCSRFHLVPEECMFIDDLQINIDGAESAGLHGHRFAGAEELISFFEKEKIL